jgi:hypothetical protein
MAETAEPWQQEIRLAMTMVGGASLAIWMGGVATETSQLLRESRRDTKTPPGLYRRLLDVLRASVSIDVLTGTSAGGINAACLGLSEAFESTPQVLRDTWITTGSLENLARDPKEAEPRSVLDGDRVLLKDVEGALREITAAGTPPAGDPDITVLLTGTMIDGETTRFDDALGNLVRDTEHRMLFRFCGLQWTVGVEAPLALAARSTASFPGAFELSRMPIGTRGTDRLHPDMTPYTELTRSHWLTDGGVLLNKPLRPALREIFERRANVDVRRLLLYVVPTGEGVTDALECDPANPPRLSSAMAKIVNTVMSQSISAELDDLTRHNDAVLRARDTRVSLAALGLRGGPDCLVDARIATAYLERRTAEDAAELVRVAARRYALAEPGTEWASGLSRRLRDIAVAGLTGDIPGTPPPASVSVDALRAYRTTALDDAVAIGLQLINAGFRLQTDAAWAQDLNTARARLHEARRTSGRGVRLGEWVTAHAGPGARSLEDWIGELAREWAAPDMTPGVAEAWPKLVGGLRAATPALRALAEAAPGKAETVTTLLNWLELTSGVPDEVVQARLLTLHVATRGLLAQAPSVDQRVDLVQVSADSRTLLDMTRRRSWDKLTGMQASYFGAFYKASWRASDWMWGRIDGAGWLVQCLLDPVRLETLRDVVGRDRFRDELVAVLKPGWRTPDEQDRCTPDEVVELRAQLTAELAFLGLDADLGPVTGQNAERPLSMPVTAMVLARTRQEEIAAEELPVVDLTARHDAEEGTARLTRTLVALGAATINAGTVAFRLPGGWPQRVAGILRTVARSTARVSQSASRLGPAGSLVAGALVLLAGLVLGNNGGGIVQWIGLPFLAGAVVYLATALLTSGHKVRWLFVALGALAAAALLLAAFLPPLARPFFGWLGDVVAAARARCGGWWCPAC